MGEGNAVKNKENKKRGRLPLNHFEVLLNAYESLKRLIFMRLRWGKRTKKKGQTMEGEKDW